MKDDDELELLLGEISHATSSLNLQHIINNAHHQHQNRNNLVDHDGCGHASLVTQRMDSHVNGPGQGTVHVMYDDDVCLRHKYACASSPVGGFHLQSDGSSSSLFSGSRHSLSDNGSSSPPQFEDFKPHLISENGFCLDFKKASESNLIDYCNFSRNFSKMYISSERGVVPVSPYSNQYCDQSPNWANRTSFEKYGAFDNYGKDFSDYKGLNVSRRRQPMNFEEVDPAFVEMQHDSRMSNLLGSPYSRSQSGRLFCQSQFGNSALSPQFYRDNVLTRNNFPMGFVIPDVSSSLDNPSVGDTLYYPSKMGMNQIEARDSIYAPNMVQLAQLLPHYNEENLVHYQSPLPNERNKVPLRVEACNREDSLIIHGEDINYGITRHVRQRGYHTKAKEKRLQLDGHPHHVTVQDRCRSPMMCCPSSMPSKYSSLAEVQGYVYHLAKDQRGCRFLQRMFEEGTSLDVQMIFNEIIDHVVELMMNPFGNYLMQKLLEVCNEEQRNQILLRVTLEPGELVRICLNTHGTRVVQKLIQTVKTKQQISVVISALEPGFLTLIKDSNGNHVVQRCLKCFNPEDSKFIFVAAAKYCVDIATHQHGCCVLQGCIAQSTGEHRENLVAAISANGLLLAQDAFGNYAVQFILDLEIPRATSKLTSQFEGNYVHLSMQKFSSHVVEKCLEKCNEQDQSKIIHELLSATDFDQLLQDPHANYVVQKALNVSEGHLHDALVDAIESYKAISRNSPYSKRIFSRKLLKR